MQIPGFPSTGHRTARTFRKSRASAFQFRKDGKRWAYLQSGITLKGTYASNERSRHLRWYLGALERADFTSFPDFIFVARHVQQPDPAFHQGRLNGYHHVGDVRVRNEPRIAIWAREPFPVTYVSYDVEPFANVFDGVVPSFDEWPDPPVQVQQVALGESMRLRSAGIETARRCTRPVATRSARVATTAPVVP